MGDTFVTPRCRVSYPHLFKPYKYKDSDKDPEFEITMLFPKASTDLNPMYQHLVAARNAKWPNTADHARIDPPGFFKDGDTSGKPEYAGCWYIKAKSNRKPRVVDQNVDPIEDIEHHRIYPGCWAIVGVSTFAWTYANKIGVKLNLDLVQLVADDEPFVTRVNPEDHFAPVNVDAEESMANAGFDPEEQAPSPTQAPPGEYMPPSTQEPPPADGEPPWGP